MRPATHGLDRCAVRLGKVLLHSLELDDLLSIDCAELKHVVTVHSEIFTYAHESAEFGRILKRTLNTIDGRILYLICSLLYPGNNVRKLTGSNFIYDLVDHAAKHGERVFLLGAEPVANQGAIDVFRAKYPHLMIDGYSPPFCSDLQKQEWNGEILRRIAQFNPAHLVVCFGPPKQERWISQNSDYLFRAGVRCAYGLGGTLDFVSGTKKRAPQWIQVVGAEWLFRLFTERKRWGRTAKMFKMPYFALKFYNREIEFFPRGRTWRSDGDALEV
jgi:N-acetylglucosaminyldiphosphoundecaprenol N-acetyl-beta-D-mannosaminyltransferase